MKSHFKCLALIPWVKYAELKTTKLHSTFHDILQEGNSVAEVTVLVALGKPNQPEDEQEDVDDVEIESQGCEDVLLRRDGVLVVTSHHHLGVVDQVEGEDESSSSSVHHLEILVVGDEDHDEAEDDEPEEDTDQDSSHHGKVPFRLGN